MRPLAYRLKGAQEMIARLNKRCKKCLKGEAAGSCAGDVCETYRDIKYFENEQEKLFREQGGVKY